MIALPFKNSSFVQRIKFEKIYFFSSSSFWPEYLTKLQVALNDFRKAFLTRAVMSYITKVKLLLQQEIHIVQRGRSPYNSYSLLRTKFFSRLVTKAFFFQWVRDRRKKKTEHKVMAFNIRERVAARGTLFSSFFIVSCLICYVALNWNQMKKKPFFAFHSNQWEPLFLTLLPSLAVIIGKLSDN